MDIGGNLRLMDLSGFPKFRFGVRAVHCRAFLLATGGGKQKLEVIPIDNHLV